MAILTIPAIGIKNMIVVEGTSPENLELGPGHVRNSPLPGQNGVAEIFGRRATFGAPFGRLMELKRGDKVTVITGQGKASYTIVARGDSRHLVQDPAPNRLLLLTACSPVIPTSYCYLDAEITSTPQQDPGGRPVITTAETPLSGDTGVLVFDHGLGPGPGDHLGGRNGRGRPMVAVACLPRGGAARARRAVEPLPEPGRVAAECVLTKGIHANTPIRSQGANPDDTGLA